MLRARVQPLETKIPQAVQPNEEGGETGGGERSRGDSENHWHTTISAVPSSRPVSVRGEPAKARAMRPSAPFLPGSSYQESPPAPFLPSSRPFLSGERRPAPCLPALPVAGSPPPGPSCQGSPQGWAACPPARRSGGNHRLPPASPPLPLCSNCHPLWFLLSAENRKD